MATRNRVPEGPAPEPVVQRLRVRYAKRGRMRFTSTRDFQRALERAVRRAGVPMAYSAGFHPHPKISYANAAPTGAASEAEFVELSLSRVADPERVRRELDQALPDGLDVVAVVEAGPEPLADRLQLSRWQMCFPGLAAAALQECLQQFLAREEVLVTRMMKRGPRELDARGPVLRAEVTDAADGPEAGEQLPGCCLLVWVRHTTPTIRPEELWRALAGVSGRELPRPRATRAAQGPEQRDADGTVQVGDPLDG
ncbi:TIGR03936 family radical SAM-associated protein [Ornithinicoccus halotolerans]|uniref:TIGR03936 family radical SAM-associated protein n=1 Tax=Ornithinicoccus halotolerans TaxID=1748220 RepID=UPI001296EA5C|nr:TIGR03936 family radical SAM-associated protein [Ornithinicoccus halotolerans]